jgi:histone H3/H4
MADPFSYGPEEARQAREAVVDASGHGRKVLGEAFGAAEGLLRERLSALRAQAGAYAREAKRQLVNGRDLVAEQVTHRPIALTLTGFCLGLLFGLLLSSRSK